MSKIHVLYTVGFRTENARTQRGPKVQNNYGNKQNSVTKTQNVSNTQLTHTLGGFFDLVQVTYFYCMKVNGL